jgi:5-(carboxyamino)imidazole ribonucleotide synthase
VGPLGILGGGQLGRMTLQAAAKLGIEVVVAETYPDSPAAQLTPTNVIFAEGWDDLAALDRLADLVDVATLENEFVDWRILEKLEQRGVTVWPTPACMRSVQDKLLQKQTLQRAELPVPCFRPVRDPAEIARFAAELGWPIMLKARRGGYDGRGNYLVRDPGQAEAACRQLGWPNRELFAESYVNFERELASLVVRSQAGEMAQYPLVETWQDPGLHICREVRAPANVPEPTRDRAQAIARGAVEAVAGVGAFGVELFLAADGQVLVNELAPRPHNTAHYTIEACWTSQFDNHVRAVLGLPLGDPDLRAPAAVMVNLLGSRDSPIDHVSVREALAEPRAFIHLYGKRENREGRKMGHVTALAETVSEARALAHAAADRVRL